MATQIVNNLVSDDGGFKQIFIDVSARTPGFSAKVKGLLMMLLKAMKRVVGVMLSLETWKQKKAWIAALIGLRAAYVLMNEYALNPFKKILTGDHVFLSGAGSGIGQLMAIKLGQLGCKLSLSDINMDGLKKTQAMCV